MNSIETGSHLDQELISEMDISCRKRQDTDETYLHAEFFFRQGCTSAELLAFGKALDKFVDEYSETESLSKLF
jgi:hypothetical protein